MSQYDSTLSHYYDALVGDLEAATKWVKWVEDYHPGPKFLELACGSGTITSLLARNHEVKALDLSASMLEEAKARDQGQLISFVQGDMRNLEGFGQYDAIGCFCDSFNYLITAEEVESFFQSVANHLVEGGYFFFDSHGSDRLNEFKADHDDYGYEEEGLFQDGTQVEWRIRSEDDFIIQDFAFYLPNQPVVLEHHVQRVYSLDFLQHALKRAGFQILEILGDFGEEPLETCEKYFIACQKRSL